MRFIPKEEKYFEMLSEMAASVAKGGAVFELMLEDYKNRAAHSEQIKKIEVDCDNLGERIIRKLNTSFITPIDREDIYLLVTELDDVIDMINSLAREMDMYGVTTLRSDSVEIARLLRGATTELADAFKLLEANEGLGERGYRIKQIEKRADAMFHGAVKRLFKEERDPIEVIKWKAIYEELENCVDRCNDVAEVLAAVVVKNK
jgi:uncharacterized protein